MEKNLENLELSKAQSDEKTYTLVVLGLILAILIIGASSLMVGL